MLKQYRLSQGKIEAVDTAGQVLVYVSPDDAERRYLVDELKLDEHTLASALDPDELGRVEFEPEHAAMIFKRPKRYSSEDNFIFKVASTGLFLFRDRLVIVINEDITIFEGKQFARVGGLPELVLKVFFRFVFHFIEHLKVIREISNELEEQVNTSMSNKHLYNLFALEKSLVYYLNAINSNSKVIDKLKASAARVGMTQENVEFLDDLVIENTQCYEQAMTYSNILASLMDARASIVSNNLNLLMKKLNIITIAIMVPTFVVSAFSMNTGIPLADHPYAFWMIMGLAGLSVASIMFLWWWKKW